MIGENRKGILDFLLGVKGGDAIDFLRKEHHIATQMSWSDMGSADVAFRIGDLWCLIGCESKKFDRWTLGIGWKRPLNLWK